ncbi:acetaldehyde dehydrogenase / alcohol dehydrogenase [Mariprofundus micogutta]|uniref:Acetaldehyde dehydrogenase / alcohol dehydrogenase n=1 Tax=Mariprofundus micogutta TaxID=1921010 RepID=A0A1L8CRG0_9PROT|nr:iron-containing alcohol dehydrogenase [Mariprofundus micogutta]GAV21464.1 acetaldehyde dehydrogenase / alcohol dehydrogenase [Mariprofundus micogutta]
MNNFFFASTPHIHFGTGTHQKLPDIIHSYGTRVLILTGGNSFDTSAICQNIWENLQQKFEIHRIQVSGEPSPQLVDEAVSSYKSFSPDCVVAIGGGSVVDAAKAVAGLLPSGDSVMEYLEGVGHGKIYTGPSTPFIALPTTAGTGGETSKNAVLSKIGVNGFKKSFRDEKLVAKHIILDAELTLSCPKHVTAACGMDAFTQLLESYVSTNANAMTDALALSGLEKIRDSLIPAVDNGNNLQAREGMLYASSISGLTLANAGLGSVHGLASPLGAFFPIPHGEVCGTLLFEAAALNIRAMRERQAGNPGLLKYAAIGRMFCQNEELPDDDAQNRLVELLEHWTERLLMPPLSNYGVKAADSDRIIDHISGGSMATNPIILTRQELTDLLSSRL